MFAQFVAIVKKKKESYVDIEISVDKHFRRKFIYSQHIESHVVSISER
jgi:hypothetical protein